MNIISALGTRATAVLLKIIRAAAVNGAGRASLRGSFEADVPESLQKEICDRESEDCEEIVKGGKYYDLTGNNIAHPFILVPLIAVTLQVIFIMAYAK